MVKILFTNEEGLPEIIWVDRIYVDPDAPTDILLSEESSILKVRIRFTDTDEADSFMDVLFECDKWVPARYCRTICPSSQKPQLFSTLRPGVWGGGSSTNPPFRGD